MALVVDLGLTRTLSVRSRAASDAAALAAASHHPTSANDPLTATAIDDAEALVHANLPEPDGGWSAAWAACVDDSPLPEGTTPTPGDCITFDYAVKQVRVTVPGRAVPSVFAGVFGASAPQASGTSTATWGDRISPTIGTCALCVRGTYSGGSARVFVTGGDAATDIVSVSWAGRLQVTGGGVTFASAWNRGGGIISPLPVKR